MGLRMSIFNYLPGLLMLLIQVVHFDWLKSHLPPGSHPDILLPFHPQTESCSPIVTCIFYSTINGLIICFHQAVRPMKTKTLPTSSLIYPNIVHVIYKSSINIF